MEQETIELKAIEQKIKNHELVLKKLPLVNQNPTNTMDKARLEISQKWLDLLNHVKYYEYDSYKRAAYNLLSKPTFLKDFGNIVNDTKAKEYLVPLNGLSTNINLASRLHESYFFNNRKELFGSRHIFGFTISIDKKGYYYATKKVKGKTKTIYVGKSLELVESKLSRHLSKKETTNDSFLHGIEKHIKAKKYRVRTLEFTNIRPCPRLKRSKAGKYYTPNHEIEILQTEILESIKQTKQADLSGFKFDSVLWYYKEKQKGDVDNVQKTLYDTLQKLTGMNDVNIKNVYLEKCKESKHKVILFTR